MSISDIDAKKDGIRVTIEGDQFTRTYKAYHIICEHCGQEYVKRQYNSDKEHLCDKCKHYKTRTIKAKERAKNEEELLKYHTKNEIKYEKAIAEMKKQVKWDSDYEKSAEIARKAVEKYGSIPEMMVAIELAYLHKPFIPQQRVCRYRVDFLIPREYIILEIDGGVYHTKQKENREAVIQLSLGLDWKILHVPAELIRADIKKLNAILQHRGNF